MYTWVTNGYRQCQTARIKKFSSEVKRWFKYSSKSVFQWVLNLTFQVKLSNPSSKPLQYQVMVAGHDARDFIIPKGDHVSIPPRSTLHLNVEFTSRFLRPAEAMLVLVGRRHGSAVGSTLTFNLRTQIDNITPKVWWFGFGRGFFSFEQRIFELLSFYSNSEMRVMWWLVLSWYFLVYK